MKLHEPEIRAQPVGPTPQIECELLAVARRHRIVEPATFGRQRQEGQAYELVLRHDLQQGIEALAPVVQAGEQVPVAPATAASETGIGVFGVDVVDALAPRRQADAVPAIEPGEGGNAVFGGEMAFLFGQAEAQQHLVAARVQPAAFEAEVDTGAAVAAVAEAGAIHAALGRRQADADRHAAIGLLFRFRQQADAGEIIQVGQRGLQAQQLRLVEGVARFPRHQFLEQARAEGVALEHHIAEAVAFAAQPGQGDVGRMLGARHFDAVFEQFRVEVTALFQPARDRQLAGLVIAMVHGFAGLRMEARQQHRDVAVLVRRTLHGQRELAHAHRLTGLYHEHHRDRIAIALDRGLGLGIVIAEGLESFLHLIRCRAQVVRQACLGQPRAPFRVEFFDRQMRAHIGFEHGIEAVDADRPQFQRL